MAATCRTAVTVQGQWLPEAALALIITFLTFISWTCDLENCDRNLLIRRRIISFLLRRLFRILQTKNTSCRLSPAIALPNLKRVPKLQPYGCTVLTPKLLALFVSLGCGYSVTAASVASVGADITFMKSLTIVLITSLVPSAASCVNLVALVGTAISKEAAVTADRVYRDQWDSDTCDDAVPPWLVFLIFVAVAVCRPRAGHFIVHRRLCFV